MQFKKMSKHLCQDFEHMYITIDMYMKIRINLSELITYCTYMCIYGPHAFVNMCICTCMLLCHFDIFNAVVDEEIEVVNDSGDDRRYVQCYKLVHVKPLFI